MTKELMGVSLERLEEPIRSTLRAYQDKSDNGIRFNIDGACQLELTPDKPNSARSATTALLQGPVGKLYVIAFKPGDGTGSQEFYQVNNLKFEQPYPASALAVPRNKVNVHSEALLTLVTHAIDDVHEEPRLFAGNFDLLVLDKDLVKKIGKIGYPESALITTPLATFTVGYKKGERFGDPHAVYSGVNAIQVCAFLAVSEDIYRNHPSIWEGLRPQYPRKP